MKKLLSVLMMCFVVFSFVKNEELPPQYTIKLEAKGCHYQISVNDQVLEESKSYQVVNKSFVLDKQLTEEGEQNIKIAMLRISREMSLKATQAYLHVSLEKKVGDSIQIVKTIRLPTFPYDDDEDQPQSIGGSIYFER